LNSKIKIKKYFIWVPVEKTSGHQQARPVPVHGPERPNLCRVDTAAIIREAWHTCTHAPPPPRSPFEAAAGALLRRLLPSPPAFTAPGGDPSRLTGTLSPPCLGRYSRPNRMRKAKSSATPMSNPSCYCGAKSINPVVRFDFVPFCTVILQRKIELGRVEPLVT
jgi:hypothetical protein